MIIFLEYATNDIISVILKQFLFQRLHSVSSNHFTYRYKKDTEYLRSDQSIYLLYHSLFCACYAIIIAFHFVKKVQQLDRGGMLISI